MSNSEDYVLDSSITQKLNQCFELDSRVPDFFSLVQQITPEEINGRKYCPNQDAYFCNTGSDATRPYIPKEQLVFEHFQYPAIVQSIIDQCVPICMGYFPLSGFFYCYSQNVLIIFDTNQLYFQIQENKDLLITSCDIAIPDKLVYETKNVSFLLVYSTDISISIVPIGKTCDKVYVNKKVTVQTTFLPTVIKAYPAEESSNIFIGSNAGEVFGLFYKFNQVKATNDVTIKNLSTSFLLSLIPKSLMFTHPIENICYDSTTCFLAAVDSNSNIVFYKYKPQEKRLKVVSKYDFQLIETSSSNNQNDDQNENKIISINEIPISDSEFIRFVCITKNGERLFFGTNPGAFNNDEIHIHRTLYPPYELAEEKFISSGFYLNYSIFVYENSVAVFHPYYHPHQPVNPTEYFDVYDFGEPLEESFLLNIGVPMHKYQKQALHLFYHELLWEHITDPAAFYLMSFKGFYKLTISRPVDVLHQLILDSKGHFSNPIREWMIFYNENYESPATLVLLASENMKSQNDFAWALTILYQYSSMKMNQTYQSSTYQSSSYLNATNINSLSPTCAGFIQRAAKLLSLIWQTPLFPKDRNDKYCLSPVFKKMPNSMKDQLKNLIDISNDYISIRRTNSPANKDAKQRIEENDEKKLLERLQKYLNNIIQVLTFISIISKQNILIDKAIQLVSEEANKRLSIDSFGEENTQISLYDALLELEGSLLSIDPNIYQLFNDDECSIFFSYENRQIIEITNKLLKNPGSLSKELLKDAEKIYLKYINQPFKLNKIVKLFKAGQYVQGIIEVCLGKANAIDRQGYALYWYKNGRNSDDKERRKYFDLRYNCYEFIFDLIEIKEEKNCNGRKHTFVFDFVFDLFDIKKEKNRKINDENLKLMLNSSDELFHICLYHRILELGHIEDLLSFTSQYIEEFLKEYAPYYQWIYSANHNKYADSAKQLIEIIEDKNDENQKKFPLAQRIEWIKNVIELAKAGKEKELEKRALHELKLAQIQLELKKKIDKENEIPQYILDDQKLIDTCCNEFQWDLVLKILSFSSVDGKDKGKIISGVWSNFFQEQLWNDPLNDALQRIEEVCGFIENRETSPLCDPFILMPVFEEHRNRKEGDVLWAVIAMLRAGFDKDKILEAYLDALNDKDMKSNEKYEQLKFDFMYVVSYLVSEMKANPGSRDLLKIKKEFTEKAGNCQYYRKAIRYMKKISDPENDKRDSGFTLRVFKDKAP